MPVTADIFNIQHFSINDGPGIRTVVFFKGCPLDCAWCHNPESKSQQKELSFSAEKCTLCGRCEVACKQNVHSVTSRHSITRHNCIGCGSCVEVCLFSALELIGKEYTVDEIMKDISKDDVFFADNGGVSFSGGEPFSQFEALYELLKMCKQKGYSTCIETSGMTTKEAIEKAAEYTDYFLYDCKETHADNHRKYTGADNKIILENLALLDSLKANVVLRCPVIPNINDRNEHFENIAEIANKYNCIQSVELMPYHSLGLAKAIQIGTKVSYEDTKFLDKVIAEKFVDTIKKLTHKNVKLSG